MRSSLLGLVGAIASAFDSYLDDWDFRPYTHYDKLYGIDKIPKVPKKLGKLNSAPVKCAAIRRPQPRNY